MLSLEEMSDRMEIQELVLRYTYALDSQDWDSWEACFAPDATIDYTETGAIAGSVKDVREYLEKTMTMFARYQHMVAGTVIDFEPDRQSARLRTMCHNPLVLPWGEGEHVFFCGIWYRDTVVRTESGWRFSSRYEELCYFYNVPELPA